MAGSALLLMDPELWVLVAGRHRRQGPTVRAPLDGTTTLVNLIESTGIPRTEVGQVVIGEQPVTLQDVPQPGDVVVVRPVARPQRDLSHRFVLDVHLGALARRMRLLGLDTLYANDATDPQLVETATRTGRTLLTQDRGLLCRRALPSGAFVRGARPDDQLGDVLDRFDPPLAPWTRCPSCNGTLQPASPAEVAHLLEPGTMRTYTEFSRCSDCGKPYWRGAHARGLDAIVTRAVQASLRLPGGPLQ